MLTGKKSKQKNYYHHSGYPGGLKKTSYQELMNKYPERAILYAVKGMLPHNRLGRKILTHLKVYQGELHPHAAQQPQTITF